MAGCRQRTPARDCHSRTGLWASALSPCVLRELFVCLYSFTWQELCGPSWPFLLGLTLLKHCTELPPRKCSDSRLQFARAKPCVVFEGSTAPCLRAAQLCCRARRDSHDAVSVPTGSHLTAETQSNARTGSFVKHLARLLQEQALPSSSFFSPATET